MVNRDTDGFDVEGILSFWYGAPGSPELGTFREIWFRKDPQFDQEIRVRFGDVVESALRGALRTAAREPRPALAEIICLDQFTRNIYRDDPRAFSGDINAVRAARLALERGHPARLTMLEQKFLFMPLMHSESLEDQELSLEQYGRLRVEFGLEETFKFAQEHYDAIKQFGRFPYRNKVLGRDSTAEEEAFLRATAHS